MAVKIWYYKNQTLNLWKNAERLIGKQANKPICFVVTL